MQGKLEYCGKSIVPALNRNGIDILDLQTLLDAAMRDSKVTRAHTRRMGTAQQSA